MRFRSPHRFVRENFLQHTRDINTFCNCVCNNSQISDESKLHQHLRNFAKSLDWEAIFTRVQRAENGFSVVGSLALSVPVFVSHDDCAHGSQTHRVRSQVVRARTAPSNVRRRHNAHSLATCRFSFPPTNPRQGAQGALGNGGS